MNTGDRQGWRKASLSNNGGQSCVEVRFDGDLVRVRDSKYLRDTANDPALQPVITILASRWHDFLKLAAGGGALGETAELPIIERHVGGGASIHAVDGTTLTYTPGEWIAFTAGVRDGEFAAA